MHGKYFVSYRFLFVISIEDAFYLVFFWYFTMWVHVCDSDPVLNLCLDLQIPEQSFHILTPPAPKSSLHPSKPDPSVLSAALCGETSLCSDNTILVGWRRWLLVQTPRCFVVLGFMACLVEWGWREWTTFVLVGQDRIGRGSGMRWNRWSFRCHSTAKLRDLRLVHFPAFYSSAANGCSVGCFWWRESSMLGHLQIHGHAGISLYLYRSKGFSTYCTLHYNTTRSHSQFEHQQSNQQQGQKKKDKDGS